MPVDQIGMGFMKAYMFEHYLYFSMYQRFKIPNSEPKSKEPILEFSKSK